jgi:hypothetical protein
LDGKRVRDLEQENEATIAKAVRKFALGNPPPSDQVHHFMAKKLHLLFADSQRWHYNKNVAQGS